MIRHNELCVRIQIRSLSWSGDLSQRVAEMLRKYLPIMLQDVDAFMSKHDVQSGARWSSELSHELETSSFGVLCLAPENLQSPWLLFEAGALTKHIEGRACGLLLRQLKPTDVTDPLSQFQHQALSTDGFFALLRDINTKLQKPLDPTQLELVFDKWWPDVDREYQDALKGCVAESYVPPRDERDASNVALHIAGEQGGPSIEPVRRGARRANAMRRAPFGTANEVADRDMRWYLDEHVEVSL
jgi:hypothetical protein